MTTHLPTESLARVHSLVAWNQESHEGPSTTVEAAPAANMENLLNTLFTRFDTQALASLREQAKLERLEDDEEKYDEEEYDEEEELDEEEQEEAERSAIMADLARRVNALDEEDQATRKIRELERDEEPSVNHRRERGAKVSARRTRRSGQLELSWNHHGAATQSRNEL